MSSFTPLFTSPTADIEIQQIKLDQIKNSGITLRMARLDQNHQLASGNKIYKLTPIFEYAKANNYKQLLSFGGAFSNHIHALALMAQQQEIESIALIRGEAEYAENPCLTDVRKAGMQLEFVSRAEYKQRHDKHYLAQLQKRYPDAMIIPEGGSHPLAIQGCAQMAKHINQSQFNFSHQQSDIFAIAAGTGVSAAGLLCGLAEQQHVNVYAVLKDNSLDARIHDFIKTATAELKHSQYSIHKADFGGYAKLDNTLLDFILSFLEQSNILLDPIYTSKMCLRVIQQIQAGEFDKQQSITLIHSGGLQGWRGMQRKVEALTSAETWKKISSMLKSD